jgi:hypothetical protein
LIRRYMKQRLLTIHRYNYFEHGCCYDYSSCQHGLCYKHAFWNHNHFYFCTTCCDHDLYFYGHLELADDNCGRWHRNGNYRWSDDDTSWIHSDADFNLYGRRIYAASFDGSHYFHSGRQHSSFDFHAAKRDHHRIGVDGYAVSDDRYDCAAVHGLDYDHSRSKHIDFDEHSSSTNNDSTAIHASDYDDSRSQHFGAYIYASRIHDFDHDDSRRQHLDFDQHASSADDYASCFDDLVYNNSRRKHLNFD